MHAVCNARFMVVEQALHRQPREDADRRADLLRGAVEHVLAEGLADLSLRPLAAALGTSARMLVYYFGSKERLILDVLAAVRRQKHMEIAALARADSLRGYWTWAASAQGQRYLRLVYEVYGLSVRDPERFGSFLSEETAEELAFVRAMFEEPALTESSRDALATYTFAAVRGFELDLLATGELARINAAFDLFEADLARRIQEGATR